MSDSRLQQLKRTWEASGSSEDEAAYLRERMRLDRAHGGMDSTGLGEVAVAFLQVVRAHWPEFLAFAARDETGGVVITYPSPHRKDEAPLWICADADLDELIVGFAHGHSHGGTWREHGDPDFQFQASIAFVQAILTENVVACRVSDGAGVIGYLEHLKTDPRWESMQAVHSWRGTHDRVSGSS